MADIQFEFAGGAGELLKELKQIKQDFVDIRDANAASKKEMAESFQQAAKGADEYQAELTKALKLQVEQKQIIESMTKKMIELEEAQAKATNGDDINKYTQRIKQLEAELNKLKNQAKGFGDETKKGVAVANQAMATLIGTIDAAKAKLASMNPSSGGYKKLAEEIKAAELATSAFSTETEESGDKMETAKKQLREFQVALQNLKLAGLDNTKVYRDLKNEAGQLSDTIGDVQEEIKAVGSDTQGIDKFIRGVQLATGVAGTYEGVVALTGERNEAFEKVMIRLNAVMTISNSLQAIMAELKRKDSVITGIQTVAQNIWDVTAKKSIVTTYALRAALVAATGGLILILSFLPQIIDKLGEWTGATNDAAEAQKKLREEQERFAQSLSTVTDQREKDRNAAKGGLDDMKRELQVMEARGDSEEKLFQKRKAILEKERFNIAVKKATFDQTIEAEKGFYDEAVRLEKDKEAEITALTESYLKTRRDKQKDINDKAVQDAEKRNERILQLEKDLAQARIDALTEGRQKEIAAENNNSGNKIADLQRQRLTASLKERQLINQLIEQEQSNHRGRLLAIDLKYYNDARQAFEDAQKAINSVLLTDQQQEEQQLIEKYDAIFKAIEESRKKNLALAQDPIQVAAVNIVSDDQAKEVTEKLEKEKLAIKEKYSLKQIQEAEELALAQNEILKIDGLTQEQLEKVKETNKLNIVIEFGKKRLAILEASGDAENALQIAQLKKVIQDAEKALATKTKSKQFGNIFELLGIDFGGEGNAAAIASALNTMKDAASEALESFIQLQDQKIAKHQEVIDAIENEISAQQDAVDREKELAEDGYANNLSIEEKRLADLKKQKDEELKLQAETQRKKEAMQKAQIIIDGISQVSGLVTASANIFSTLSAIPFVGIPLAIATIATMFGAFAAAKVNAFKNVGKAEKGKRVASGNRHSGGGNKYVSMDGNDPDILEIEQGEWVVNRKSSAKYDPLLQAINDDRLSAMSTPQLQRMLEPLGIRLQDDLPEKIVKQYDQVTYNNSNSVTQQDNHIKGELLQQNKLLERIAHNTEKTVEYYDGYRIEREGNRTRKIIEQ